MRARVAFLALLVFVSQAAAGLSEPVLCPVISSGTYNEGTLDGVHFELMRWTESGLRFTMIEVSEGSHVLELSHSGSTATPSVLEITQSDGHCVIGLAPA